MGNQPQNTPKEGPSFPSHVNTEELKTLLDVKHDQYNNTSFIKEDPIFIPHQFTNKEDIEIAAFLTAIIAWGRRNMILMNAMKLLERMDMEPHDFILNCSPTELERLADFVHRTFNGIDAVAMVKALKRVYLEEGGLERIFTKTVAATDANIFHGINYARDQLIKEECFPLRTHKHIANPAKNSSAKRINMFLRWMVRNDHRGVDFGLWKGIAVKQLVCPLDVHTATVSRKLGLLSRKQNDWKAAVELTENLKVFSPDDPVKYDFSLFGLGVYEKF